MITSAVILALSNLTPRVGELWNASLAGRPLLEHVVRNCEACGLIDELVIVTDDPSLMERRPCFGVRVHPCPVACLKHSFNFLNIEQQGLNREFELNLEAGLHTDVSFYLPWNMPFLDARILETMYHKILDDPVAARVIPMSAVDPQLFARIEGAHDFFPVWGQKGLDRQLIQQLYRVENACITHWNRLLRTLPKLAGLPLERARVATMNSPEDIDLGESLHTYLSPATASAL